MATSKKKRPVKQKKKAPDPKSKESVEAKLPIWYGFIAANEKGEHQQGVTKNRSGLEGSLNKTGLKLVWVTEEASALPAVMNYLTVVQKMAPELKDSLSGNSSNPEKFLTTVSKMSKFLKPKASNATKPA